MVPLSRLAWAFALVAFTAGCQSYGVGIKQMSASEAAADFAAGPDREMVRAACEGNRTRVKSAIAEGADPNALAQGVFSPLAAMLGCRSISGIGLLVEVGADPNQKIGDGYTLVAMAASQADSRLLEALLKAGADPNIDSNMPYEQIRQAISAHRDTERWTNLDLMVRYGLDLDRYEPTGGQQRFKPTQLFTLADSLKVCKALEFVRAGPRVNEALLAIGVEIIRFREDTEQYRCQQELIGIVKDRMGIEAFEQYRHDFVTRPELTGKTKP